MRKPLIGGNWKMNGTSGQAACFIEEIRMALPSGDRPEVVVFPPFTLISGLRETARAAGVLLGGQDIFWEEEGAFTGEISPRMLRDAGCTWFLAGHSERRHILGENDGIVRLKLQAGISSGLNGILCVGELEDEREAGMTEKVVRHQISEGITDLDVSPFGLAIAYEPVWAIGTGLTATPLEAQRIHSLIRGWITDINGSEFAENLRIIYGGSVKPENAAAIMEGADVDGALVGGASLSAGSFADIVAASCN
jgi:triosephosphate isomerase